MGRKRSLKNSSFPRKRKPSYQRLMAQDFSPTVYLLASRRNGTIYTGVTSNRLARIAQRRDGRTAGFSLSRE